MGLGYPRGKNKTYDDPLAAPGRPYRRDTWRWIRALLIVAFFLFDLVGVIFLFFPHVISQPPTLNAGPQILLLPTPVAAAPSLTPSARATPTARVTQQVTLGGAATSSPTRAASASLSATATNLPAGTAPGLYVQALRTDPQVPRRNRDVYFVVTFLNTTGTTHQVRWDVLVYRAENLNQYFGQSLPIGKGDSIGPGSQELRSSGPYKLFGGGGCEDVVVRVARMEGDKPTALIDQPDGRAFLQAMTFCP